MTFPSILSVHRLISSTSPVLLMGLVGWLWLGPFTPLLVARGGSPLDAAILENNLPAVEALLATPPSSLEGEQVDPAAEEGLSLAIQLEVIRRREEPASYEQVSTLKGLLYRLTGQPLEQAQGSYLPLISFLMERNFSVSPRAEAKLRGAPRHQVRDLLISLAAAHERLHTHWQELLMGSSLLPQPAGLPEELADLIIAHLLTPFSLAEGNVLSFDELPITLRIQISLASMSS